MDEIHARARALANIKRRVDGGGEEAGRAGEAAGGG